MKVQILSFFTLFSCFQVSCMEVANVSVVCLDQLPREMKSEIGKFLSCNDVISLKQTCAKMNEDISLFDCSSTDIRKKGVIHCCKNNDLSGLSSLVRNSLQFNREYFNSITVPLFFNQRTQMLFEKDPNKEAMERVVNKLGNSASAVAYVPMPTEEVTLLTLAVFKQDSSMIRLLIDNGADPQYKDNNGCTSFDYMQRFCPFNIDILCVLHDVKKRDFYISLGAHFFVGIVFLYGIQKIFRSAFY